MVKINLIAKSNCLSKEKFNRPALLFTALNPVGEIGRRNAFRWQRSKGCAGSNPGISDVVIIGQCKPSTDLKTSLNDALRDFNVSA